MGASSAEIDQEIRDARGELEQNLKVLERRAARGARVYGRMAAGVAVGVAVVVVGVVVYRRRRQKRAVNQLQRVLSNARDLPEELTSRLKERLPIKVVIASRDDETGEGGNAWTAIASKVAPNLVGSATGAVMARLRGTPQEAVRAE
jgi:hypothetical protein